MNIQEFASCYQRLQVVYDRLPALTPPIAEEWVRVIGSFDKRTVDAAITDYMAKERYKPTPAELRRYCFEAKKRLYGEEILQKAQELKDCPYCAGCGFFLAEGKEYCGKPEIVAYHCACAASADPEKGIEILQKALAEPKYRFDEGSRCFVKLKGWIGAQPNSREAVKEAFEHNNVSRLIGR